MQNQMLLGKTFHVTTAIRCDYCHRIIPVGKNATKISGDSSIKAQGIFHGKQCYEAAKNHYEELENKMK